MEFSMLVIDPSPKIGKNFKSYDILKYTI